MSPLVLERTWDSGSRVRRAPRKDLPGGKEPRSRGQARSPGARRPGSCPPYRLPVPPRRGQRAAERRAGRGGWRARGIRTQPRPFSGVSYEAGRDGGLPGTPTLCFDLRTRARGSIHNKAGELDGRRAGKRKKPTHHSARPAWGEATAPGLRGSAGSERRRAGLTAEAQTPNRAAPARARWAGRPSPGSSPSLSLQARPAPPPDRFSGPASFRPPSSSRFAPQAPPPATPPRVRAQGPPPSVTCAGSPGTLVEGTGFGPLPREFWFRGSE